MTLSQWDSLLKNLGCWQGSFTRVSATGEIIEDIPSETTLRQQVKQQLEGQVKALNEGKDENKPIQQIIRQFYPSGTQEKILEYSSLARSVLFFENGAFSQGSTQVGFNSEFGAELGLIDGNARRRLVQLFNKNGELSQLTYIRENLAEALTEKPPQTQIQASQIGWEQLQGKWQCQVVTLYADWRSPDLFTTETEWLDRTRISTIGNNIANKLSSKIESNIQPLFLPDGVASICPAQIKFGKPLSLEVLWLIQPDRYQQMIRHYDDRGGWISLTLAIASLIQEK
jgi:Domain of unknown function (DUF3598)